MPLKNSKGKVIQRASETGKLLNPMGEEIRMEVLESNARGCERYEAYVNEVFLGPTYPKSSHVENPGKRFNKELVLQKHAPAQWKWEEKARTSADAKYLNLPQERKWRPDKKAKIAMAVDQMKEEIARLKGEKLSVAEKNADRPSTSTALAEYRKQHANKVPAERPFPVRPGVGWWRW